MRETESKKAQKKPPFLGHILAIEIDDFLPGGNSKRTRSRVIPNILHLLDHIDKHRSEGNFFIAPNLMNDFPEIISLVSSRGHEIGICCNAESASCTESIESARDSLEKITGHPAYGIMLKSNDDKGREYLRHFANYGFSYCLVDFKMASRDRTALPISITYDTGSFINVFPPSLYNFLGIELLFGMPGKIRLYPYWFLRQCVRQFTHSNMSAIINFPLWEFDPHLPRQVLSPLQSLKSYGNLSLAEFKLTRMLLDFDFVKITRILGIEGFEDN